jgi:hypothetical protein
MSEEYAVLLDEEGLLFACSGQHRSNSWKYLSVTDDKDSRVTSSALHQRSVTDDKDSRVTSSALHQRGLGKCGARKLVTVER